MRFQKRHSLRRYSKGFEAKGYPGDGRDKECCINQTMQQTSQERLIGGCKWLPQSGDERQERGEGRGEGGEGEKGEGEGESRL